MCKTSAKKNLYWEIKDKVVEEAFDGLRTGKVKRKVREFGLNSTKEIRARLIQILYDRVAYHKDKFVAPILHKEMQAMEVKKNGKVEHSDNSHDDQVFSYLMALYVWYDGKNLMENFHIQKNTIKTDADEDIEELEIEDSLECTEHIDVDSLSYDPDSELSDTYNSIVEQSKLVTSKDLKEQEYLLMNKRRMTILATDKNAREAYCKETGLDENMFKNNQSATFTTLPDELFMDVELDLEDEIKDPVLQGNLSDMWNKL